MSRLASSHTNQPAIIELRERLAAIRRLRFTARPGPHSRTGWAGQGEADVRIGNDNDGLRFHESGMFTPAASGTPVAFRNVYRWQFHDDRVALWHERFGHEAAVWLFDLVAVRADVFTAADSHLCGSDRYDARLTLVDAGFDLCWTIAGPRKDETLAYHYRC